MEGDPSPREFQPKLDWPQLCENAAYLLVEAPLLSAGLSFHFVGLRVTPAHPSFLNTGKSLAFLLRLLDEIGDFRASQSQPLKLCDLGRTVYKVLDLPRDRRSEAPFTAKLIRISGLELLDAFLDVFLRDTDLDEPEVVVRVGRIDEREEVYLPRTARLGVVSLVRSRATAEIRGRRRRRSQLAAG